MKNTTAACAFGMLLFAAWGGGAGADDLHPADANTPIGASQAPEDLQVNADIHRALLQDDSLSTSARHIQSVTNSEAIVLRGAVRPEEVDAVEQKVKQYAGLRQVINQLTVADY